MQQTMPQQPMQGTPQQKPKGLGIAGLILGIIGISTFWLLTFISMILGIIGLILGAIAFGMKWQDSKAGLAGLILGIITIVITILWVYVILPAIFFNAIAGL